MKGKSILVEGSLQTRKWQDKDVNDRYTTEIKAHRITLLGGGGGRRDGAEDQRRQGTGEDGPQQAPAADASGMEPLSDDDIPFAWLLPLLTMAGSALLGQ